MPAGRPTEYRDDYHPQRVLDYINECEDEIEEYHKTRGDKSDSYDRIVKVKLPSIEGLAVFLDVNKTTIYEWESTYPQFSNVIDKLRQKQASELINKGLSGDYNPTIAKVLLTKHGYREGQELTGKDGEALKMPVTINIVKPDEKQL